MIRRLVAAAATLALTAVMAVPAASQVPPDWTLVNRDGSRHYACKLSGKGDTWRIRTLTRGKADTRGIYVAVARGSNRRLPIERQSKDWDNGSIRLFLRGVLTTDRLWMQNAGYGPVEPWSDGFPVRRIRRCFSPA